MRLSSFTLCIIVFTFIKTLPAQIDSIIFKNDNYIVGEIKDMDRGVLTIETDFSDKDFKIEWDRIREIYTQTYFLISLTDGRRFNGRLNSATPDTISLATDSYGVIGVTYPQVVFLKKIEAGFADRFIYSVDLSFSLTKANNLSQYSSRSTVGYLAKNWSIAATYNGLRSIQEEADLIRRTDGGLVFRYVMRNNWFFLPEVAFLSNTEQKLKLQTTAKLGLGKYVIRTNRFYWGFNGGLSFNYEDFSSDDPDRRGLEGFLGTGVDLYDIGDLQLVTQISAYPSITDPGRWRVNGVLDIKYDLPLDFYIKVGITYNYNNRPVEGASETDYVLQTGFGWEW